MLSEIGVSGVARCERLGFGIDGVLEMGLHYVARAAEFAVRGGGHAGDGRRQSRERGQRAEAEQKKDLLAEIERRPAHQMANQDCRSSCGREQCDRAEPILFVTHVLTDSLFVGAVNRIVPNRG
jgi:hypothetical protein